VGLTIYVRLSYFVVRPLQSLLMATRSRRAYHHGDLPTALVDATLDLIAENGVQGFSVAEAARRTGVSISAPYRHFADRDELLAATAVRAHEELLRRFEDAIAGGHSPADQAAALSAAYVHFAVERKAMFEVLFGAGLDKQRYPQLAASAGRIVEALVTVTRRLTPDGSDEHAWALVQAMVALAQGHATLLLDGASGTPAPEVVDTAAEQAAAATRALVRGRSLIFDALQR
jgi:AcrR family transcriptional regulator